MNSVIKSAKFTPSFRGGADTFERSVKDEAFELKLNGESTPVLKEWTKKFYALGLTPSHLELVTRLSGTLEPEYLASMVIADPRFTPGEVLDEFKEEASLDIKSLSDKELKTYLTNARNFDPSLIDNDTELLEDLPVILILDKDQIKKVKPFMDSYRFLPVLLEAANLSKDEIKKFGECVNTLKNDETIKNIPLTNIDYFNIFKSNSPSVMERLRFLSDHKTDSIFGSNFTINDAEYALKLACSDEELWDKALGLIGKNKDEFFNTFNPRNIYKYANLDDKSYNKTLNLSNMCRIAGREIYPFEIDEALKLDDEHYNKMLKYLNLQVKYHQLNVSEAKLLASLDENEADFVLDNLKYFDYTQMQAYIASHCVKDIGELPFVTRTDYYQQISGVLETLEKNNISDKHSEDFKVKLEHSLVGADVCIDVPKENIKALFENFLTNKKAGPKNPDFNPNISEPENILANSKELLISYGLNGLPVDYSRSDFLYDLTEVLKNSSDDEIRQICEKLAIKPIMNGKTITGYDGILKLGALDLNDSTEKKVYGIAANFVFDNSVNTGDEALDNVLNSVISAFPEFINSVGKRQTPAHRYSNDIHSLLVLANCVSNPKYEKLSDSDKTCLKLGALFHDIGKADNRLDRGHQNTSAVITESILEKLSLSDAMKENIFEIVQNHHWLEELKNGKIDNQKCSFMFRRHGGFEMAKILAEADLRGIGSADFEKYCDDLNSPLVNSIEPAVEHFQSDGNAVYSTSLLKPDKIPEKLNEDGRKFRVLNFNKIDDDEDLEKYGFFGGTKKDDLRFLIHMVPSEDDLKRLKFLSKSNSAGVLSESLISLANNRTYCNRKYGVLLSNLPYNVIEMSKDNIGSGTKKDLNYAARTCAYSSARKNFKAALLKELNLQDKVSEREYGEFYENILSKKRMLTQFNSSKVYKLGDYDFSSDEIKNALKKVSDRFINPNEDDQHNEFTAYHPKITGVIAKSNSLDETPKFLLDYAYENNLPVYLIGRDK